MTQASGAVALPTVSRSFATCLTLFKLRHLDNPTERQVAQALSDVAAHCISTPEQEWIQRIEALRTQPNQSSETVSVTSFETGTPDSRLSSETVAQGRTSMKQIGEICRVHNLPPRWTFLLFRLIRTLRPLRCLELGNLPWRFIRLSSIGLIS